MIGIMEGVEDFKIFGNSKNQQINGWFYGKGLVYKLEAPIRLFFATRPTPKQNHLLGSALENNLM